MKQATYVRLVASMFALVALFHVYRLVTGMPLLIGSWSVPSSISVLGFIVATGLSWIGFKSRR